MDRIEEMAISVQGLKWIDIFRDLPKSAPQLHTLCIDSHPGTAFRSTTISSTTQNACDMLLSKRCEQNRDFIINPLAAGFAPQEHPSIALSWLVVI